MSDPLLIRTVLGQGKVEYIDHMGTDLTVVNAARVSFNRRTEWDPKVPDNPTLKEADQRLINYLAEHNHWTPFAHPQITFRIKAPIPIRTQFFKHKQGFLENELSKRYVTTTPEVYTPIWRGAPIDGAKQGSSEFFSNETDIDGANQFYYTAVSAAIKAYYFLINDMKVAPEQARMVLPQGAFTEWYWTGSLAAYARFYKQRISSSAQWEIRVYAEAIGNFVSSLFPYSWDVLTKTDKEIEVPTPSGQQVSSNTELDAHILTEIVKAKNKFK
jgi:thymidylate synthase (FAD)